MLLLFGLTGCSSTSTNVKSDSSTGPDYATDGSLLTESQLLRCRTDLLLLEGSAEESDPTNLWELQSYQKSLSHYRKQCENRRYLPEVFDATAASLDTRTTLGIKKAGARRVALNRMNRQVRLRHVAQANSPVYKSPSSRSARIESLGKWQDVFVLNGKENRRTEIEWVSATVPKTVLSGWITNEHIEPGSGEHARTEYCLERQGHPIEERELLHGASSRDRFPMLEVENPANQDAYIKLVGTQGDVVSAFIVPANETKRIYGLPRGSYKLWFVTGNQFSRGCDSFSVRGIAGRMQGNLVYDDHTLDWSISLDIPSLSPLHADLALYQEFEDL